MEDNTMVTYFTEEEINEIKNHLANYAIKIYEENGWENDDYFKHKYQKAKELRKSKLDKSIDEIKEYLDQKYEKFQINIENNKPQAIYSNNNIKEILKIEISNIPNELDRLNFIYDFVTETFKYSYDISEYWSIIPSKYGQYYFGFDKTLPVEHSELTSLTYRKEVCEGISFTIRQLGFIAGLDIKTEGVTFNNTSHYINNTIYAGQKTLIDATRKIKNEATKKESFLVDKDELQKIGSYIFDNDDKTATIPNIGYIPYKMDEVIEKINILTPKVTYQEYEKHDYTI